MEPGPEAADRIEEPGSVVPTRVALGDYYRTDDPEAVLVLSAGRIGAAGAHWLRLLCGHCLFTAEPVRAGFGTAAHHVSCPKCREGLAADI